MEILELVNRLRRGGWMRNLFFGIVAVAVALLLLVRYLILPVVVHHPVPSLADDLGQVDDLLLVTLVGSVLVITFLVFFLPGPPTSDRMTEVEPHRIADILRDGADEATEWWYSGNTGRHFRAKTLPLLGDRATKRRRGIDVHLMILDPTSTRSCDTYSAYLQASSSKADRWDARRVRNELFATIVCAYVAKVANPLLSINVGFREVVSVFRIDFWPRLALISMESKSDPALTCAEGGLFHDRYRRDLELSWEQCRHLDDRIAGLESSAVNAGSVVQLLKQLGLGDVSEADGEVIAGLAHKPKDPYD